MNINQIMSAGSVIDSVKSSLVIPGDVLTIIFKEISSDQRKFFNLATGNRFLQRYGANIYRLEKIKVIKELTDILSRGFASYRKLPDYSPLKMLAEGIEQASTCRKIKEYCDEAFVYVLRHLLTKTRNKAFLNVIGESPIASKIRSIFLFFKALQSQKTPFDSVIFPEAEISILRELAKDIHCGDRFRVCRDRLSTYPEDLPKAKKLLEIFGEAINEHTLGFRARVIACEIEAKAYKEALRTSRLLSHHKKYCCRLKIVKKMLESQGLSKKNYDLALKMIRKDRLWTEDPEDKTFSQMLQKLVIENLQDVLDIMNNMLKDQNKSGKRAAEIILPKMILNLIRLNQAEEALKMFNQIVSWTKDPVCREVLRKDIALEFAKRGSFEKAFEMAEEIDESQLPFFLREDALNEIRSLIDQAVSKRMS